MANTNTTTKQEVNPKQEVKTFMKEVEQPISQQSDFDYYTSERFLKKASVSIVPVGLIGAYCYHKKFSLTKSALLVSIPIIAISILQNIGLGGSRNAYWKIFTPPSARTKIVLKEAKQVQK